MDYKGTIIEKSLENKDVLYDVKILSTKVDEILAVKPRIINGNLRKLKKVK